MIQSMTGYGQGKSRCGDGEIAVEVKSVNRSSLEMSIRLPDGCLFLEQRVRKYIQEKLYRGHITVQVQDRMKTKKETIKLNEELIRNFSEAVDDLKNWSGMNALITLGDILRIDGVIIREIVDVEEASRTEAVESALKIAVDGLIDMRVKEGESLYDDIISRIKKLEEIVQNIRSIAPYLIKRYQEQLTKRMQELIPEGIDVDENRLYTEVAIFSEKCDVTEELVRLDSHIKLFRETLQNNDAVGKKLDFILQEMNRESNTIGSKAAGVELTERVIALRDEIEKIREQVQNVE